MCQLESSYRIVKELKEIKRHNTQKKNKKNQRPLLNLRSYYERYVPEDIPFSVFERKVTEIEARSTQTCAWLVAVISLLILILLACIIGYI